jgi:hypothetical protein
MNTNVQPIRTVEDLVRDLADAQYQQAAIGERIAMLKAQLADQIGVGGNIQVGDATISVREPSRRFNPTKAQALLAPEVLELCKTDGYDNAKLKSFLSPVLLEQCMDAGTGSPIVSLR